MSLSPKKQLQRKRMMTYFIDATDEIINAEGIDALTIRKVSDIAGYNSATIYNYFDNLDHLIFMTVMNYLKDYTAAIPAYIKPCHNSLETFLAIWDCFCKYSFEKPEMYRLLFFTNLNNKFEEYTKQYYDIFPEKITSNSKSISNMLRRSNIYSRGMSILEDCVIENIFSKEDAIDYNNISFLIYESQLAGVIRKTITPEEARKSTMKYFFKILTAYLDPKHLSLLDNIKEFK